MRSKRLFRSSLLLALAILVPLVSLPLAHAAINLVSISANATGEVSLDGVLGHGMGQGSWQVSQTAFVVQIIISLGKFGSPTGTGIVKIFNDANAQSGGFCSTSGGNVIGSAIDVSNSFDLSTVSTGFGSPFTITFPSLIQLVSTNCYDWVVSQETGFTDVNNVLRMTGASSEFGPAGSGAQITICTPAPTCSFSGSLDASGWEIDGTTDTGTTTTVTQCYGNCGSPPITLANANSTHTVNFNQTITLFYQFQSNLNGFLLNITTSMAKSYTALPNGPAFGIYTIQSCPLGQLPFSPQCPGLLQAQSPGQNFFSPPKGKISFSGLRIPVFTGQWVGIALSAFLSGLDVNDTNTNVNLWQTNEGKIPSSIQNPISLGNSKVGLWAWINGNIITGGPPPSSPSAGNCGPGLDFILACAVNSLCTVVTTQCQTGSSIFLIVILTIVSIAVLLGIFSYWLPGMNLTTKGMGEFAVLIFIGWFVAFAAYGLLLPYMIIFMFFVVAWLFLGRSRGTGPI